LLNYNFGPTYTETSTKIN